MYRVMNLVLFSFILSACMGQSRNLTLDIYSEPEGASIYEVNSSVSKTYIGESPMRLRYSLGPSFHSQGYMDIKELYAVWPSGAESTVRLTRLYSVDTTRQQVVFQRPYSIEGREQDEAHAASLRRQSQIEQQQAEERDLQRLQKLNNYLQQQPGGSNYNPPKSCWLTAQTSDLMNTYCIYECTDGTSETKTQIKGMSCM